LRNRISTTFDKLRREKRCGLVAYVTCGDPDVETTIDVILALEGAGADFIELGVPFSDPIADGPVIQAASFRALQRGTTMADVLAIAKSIRTRSEIPLVLFSYLNPILQFGFEKFAQAAAESGCDGVLVTDLPPEFSKDLRSAMKRSHLRTVFLLSPTSSGDRIKLVDKMSDGFVYYVSTTGVTGARKDLDPALIGRLSEVRSQLTTPLAVGFGISTHEHYAVLSDYCDAVVVGSAIVKAVGDGDRNGAAERAADVVRGIVGPSG